MKLFWKGGLRIISFLFILKLILKTVVKRREDAISIPHATPTEVWEFMADFSNQKILNPKLLYFQILSDNTNKLRKGYAWTYSVRYTELFETIPFGTNTAVGNFSIFQDQKLQDLVIMSEHVTCLLPRETWCLHTLAENRFRFEQTGTEVTEVVNYSCPWALQPICTSEIDSQRKKVLNNLRHTVFSVL